MVGVMVSEASLTKASQAILKKAESWYTIAYGVDEDRLVVRGRRGEQQFMAVWRNGKADCAYWWTRQHEAWADLPRQLVRWGTPAPTPVKVGFRELGKLLQSEVELPHD